MKKNDVTIGGKSSARRGRPGQGGPPRATAFFADSDAAFRRDRLKMTTTLREALSAYKNALTGACVGADLVRRPA